MVHVLHRRYSWSWWVRLSGGGHPASRQWVVSGVYVQQGVMEILNFRKAGEMVKPYRVRQLLNMVEGYDLLKNDAA